MKVITVSVRVGSCRVACAEVDPESVWLDYSSVRVHPCLVQDRLIGLLENQIESVRSDSLHLCSFIVIYSWIPEHPRVHCIRCPVEVDPPNLPLEPRHMGSTENVLPWSLAALPNFKQLENAVGSRTAG